MKIKSTEEWYKLGDHLISDIIIRIPKELANDHALRRGTLAERYVSGEINVELAYVLRWRDIFGCFIAIFEKAPSEHGVGTSESFDLSLQHTWLPTEADGSHMSGQDKRQSVFISIPERIEDIKDMFLVRSFVRLYARNPVLNFLRESSELRQICREKVRFTSEFEREIFKVIPFSSRLGKTLSASPHEIVQSGSQVVNSITCGQAECICGLLVHFKDMSDSGIVCPIEVNFFDHIIWPRATIKKGTDISVEFLDATIGPGKSGPDKLHIIRTGVTQNDLETTTRISRVSNIARPPNRICNPTI